MAPLPFHWIDPRTWPRGFDLWLAFVLLGFSRPVWRWLQSRRAETWPAVQGRVDSTFIKEGRVFYQSSSRPSIASFKYFYDVGGTKYFGTYQKKFGTDEESEDFLRDLAGKDVRVQYRSGKPSRSLLLESSIKSLLSSRAPSTESPLAVRRYRNPLPIWFTRILPLIETLALMGFALSVLINIGTMTSRWTPPSYLWALHGGIFVVFFPAMFVAQKRVGSTSRKDLWKVLLKDAPDWMKYFLYALFAYGFVISIPTWSRGVLQPSSIPKSSDFSDWSDFSAIWMVFYWASFAILYATSQQERQAPRCVNGHPIAPGASFCTQCGQSVVRT